MVILIWACEGVAHACHMMGLGWSWPVALFTCPIPPPYTSPRPTKVVACCPIQDSDPIVVGVHHVHLIRLRVIGRVRDRVVGRVRLGSGVRVRVRIRVMVRVTVRVRVRARVRVRVRVRV